jgi:NADPH:quinone reductase-like Zn-dependent oxidoreductase
MRLSAEVLQFDELPLPEPAPGEVRLRVKARGLNCAEIMFRNDQYLETPIHPSKNGYEAAGVIEAVGSGVDSSWIGKTVSTVPGTFKLNDHGVYGEVAVVPVHGIAEYPSALSYEQGASIWMQYLTAYGALSLLGVCWTLRKRLAFDKHVDMYEGLGRAQSPRSALLTRGMGGEICQTRRSCAQHDHHSPITGSIDLVEVRHMSLCRRS